LEQEIKVQVCEDGADYESSVPYHRLVTELFLGAAHLARLRNQPLSSDFAARLRGMVQFLLQTLRPDGLMPQVGDADDGRLHILSEYGTWNPQDARHVLAAAAIHFDEPRWLRYAGESGRWEAAWWGADLERLTAETDSLPPTCRVFPQTGVAVARDSQTYLLITNGRVGTNGYGNHKHNDQLGFEFHCRGVPLFVDPGSYVYTSDPTARNLFRGTAYHNTLRVDGLEQNEFRPEWLFRMFEKAEPDDLLFEARDGAVECRGRHRAYQRLTSPVIHDRTFRLLRDSGTLLLCDSISGSGRHRIEWHFHCAPGIEVIEQRDGLYVLRSARDEHAFLVPDGLRGVVNRAWYSPSYGVRVACWALDLSCDLQLHRNHTWVFVAASTPCLAEQARDRFLSSTQRPTAAA
jgi:hypothetical protein